MSVDMSLISIKDGGRFAMSWLAGTNPKALRSNFQRRSIYEVDVIHVCEEMIKSVKSKDNKLTFRILIRLCFGTVRIFSEQVNHLYDVTLNFVCFNNFVLKHYSRKRLSSSTDGPENSINSKRIRLESSEDLDISSLLMESEMFNNYTEEKFQFPNEVGHTKKRKENTATCIQIKQITIRHVSWDAPMPEEDDAFGDASQDERSFLLSGLNDSFQRPRTQKRLTSYNTVECSPTKKPCLTNESTDDVRYNQSSCYDSMSEADYDPTPQQSTYNTTDFNENDLNQIDFESTRLEAPSKEQQPSDQVSDIQSLNQDAFDDSNDLPRSPLLLEYICQNQDDDNASRAESLGSTITFEDENPKNSTFSPAGKKRNRSQIRFDTTTQIPVPNLDDILKNCLDYEKGEHIISAKKPRLPISLNKRIISSRFQSSKLLSRFTKNVKPRLQQQNHDYNRRLIVSEILEDDYDELKHLFKIKETFSESRNRKKRQIQRNQLFVDTNKELVDDNNNNVILNNIETEKEPPSNMQFETNSSVTQKERLTLNCSIEEVNPFEVSFDFPLEAGHQRSEWGKEGIMNKLLFAWTSEDSVVNMKSILFGANRINAALAFHTLLDLAGQHYIEIVKNQTNSIESIEMGPESIKKINASLSA